MQNAKFKMHKLTARVPALFAFCIVHFALLLSLAGCSAKVKAQTLPDGPPLAVPSPPAHEIAIEQVVEAPPPEQPPAPEPAQTPAARPTTAARTPPRQEPRAEAPAAAPAPQPPPETPSVRATPAASVDDERRVRTLLAKAADDLGKRVDYKKLSDEGKAQYNQSKRFSDQALQALKERNFVYALTLAEKAATLAAELVR
jgi:type IV secretory pathway VirB10-like protein